jgi:hypothetical protein
MEAGLSSNSASESSQSQEWEEVQTMYTHVSKCKSDLK